MTTLLADRFWQCDRDLADACLLHPFVRGLADGSLPPWRYRDYVAQDAFFLRAFAGAYQLAGARCADADGRALYVRLAQGVEDELQLHRRQAERLGIDLQRVQATDATLAYTEFLTATAATRPEPCAAAAMLPCLRLYAWLGAQLLPALAPSSPYGDWVRAYADPGFTALWRLLAPRLAGAGADSDELAALHRRAMHLEHRFFAAAWGGDAPGRPLVRDRSLDFLSLPKVGGGRSAARVRSDCRMADRRACRGRSRHHARRGEAPGKSMHIDVTPSAPVHWAAAVGAELVVLKDASGGIHAIDWEWTDAGVLRLVPAADAPRKEDLRLVWKGVRDLHGRTLKLEPTVFRLP